MCSGMCFAGAQRQDARRHDKMPLAALGWIAVVPGRQSTFLFLSLLTIPARTLRAVASTVRISSWHHPASRKSPIYSAITPSGVLPAAQRARHSRTASLMDCSDWLDTEVG